MNQAVRLLIIYDRKKYKSKDNGTVFYMIIFVTGVCGQLGHDVMNELLFRGYTGIGSDI